MVISSKMDLLSSHMLLLANETEEEILERALRESQMLHKGTCAGASRGIPDDDDVIVVEDSSGSDGEQQNGAGWLQELDMPDEFWEEAQAATEPPRSPPQVYAGQEARGFDLALGQHWIYPTNCELRQYQYDIVERALFHNTLVSLPTGLGKTLIAAVVMYNFYRWYPRGKVVFLAPSRPLVAQQIDACYRVMGIPARDTAELTGQLRVEQREALWRERRVFFATPQVVTNDLGGGSCRAEAVHCVVVDEAHRALGDHAYCQVIRLLDMFNQQYRVLALSATPGADLQAVQQVLRNLKISHVELRSEESVDVQPYVQQRNVELVVLPLGDRILRLRDRLLGMIDERMKPLRVQGALSVHTSQLSKFKLMKLRDHWRATRAMQLDKRARGLAEVDFLAGMSLCHALELLVEHGMRAALRSLEGLVERSGVLPGWGGRLPELLEEVRHEAGPEDEPNVHAHPKLEQLEQVVREHFEACERSGTPTRVIVFAQYRDSAVEICRLLQRHQPLVRPMQFIGQLRQGKGGFTQKQQLEVVRQFCTGGYNTLVSTCVGEEGLDIGEVDLIVCFDTSNCVRLKQRMGRTGRKRAGRILMLLTQGKEYQKYMRSVQQTRTIGKHLLKLDNLRPFLNQQSPRMLPPGVVPQCRKVFVTVEERQPRAAAKARLKGDVRRYLGPASSPYLSAEELAELGPEPIANFDHLGCLQPGHPGVEGVEGQLAAWVDWQLELQPRFTVEPSQHSRVLVDLLQRSSSAYLPSSQTCLVASQMAPRTRVRRKPGPRSSRSAAVTAEPPPQDDGAASTSSANPALQSVDSSIGDFRKPGPVGKKRKEGRNVGIAELLMQTAKTEQDKIIENIFKDFRHKLQVFEEEWRSVGGLSALCDLPRLSAVLDVCRRRGRTCAVADLSVLPSEASNTEAGAKRGVGESQLSLSGEGEGGKKDTSASGSPGAVETVSRGMGHPRPQEEPHTNTGEDGAAGCEELRPGGFVAPDDSDGHKQQEAVPLHFDLALFDWFDDDQSVELLESSRRAMDTGARSPDAPCLSPIPHSGHNSTLLLTPPCQASFARPLPLTSPTLVSFCSNLPNMAASTPKPPVKSSASGVTEQLQFDVADVDELMREFEEEALVGDMDELREHFRTDVGEGGSVLNAEQFCRMLRDPGSELYAVSPEVRRQMEVIYKGVREPWQYGTRVTKVSENKEVRWWQRLLREREACQKPTHPPAQEDDVLPDVSFLERSCDTERNHIAECCEEVECGHDVERSCIAEYSQEVERICDAEHGQRVERWKGVERAHDAKGGQKGERQQVRRKLSLCPRRTGESYADDSVVVRPVRRRQVARLDVSAESLLGTSAADRRADERKGVEQCQFLDVEANVSLQQACVSSDEDTSGLDSYDSSFVDDSVTDATGDLQAKFLHSIIRSPAVPRQKPFSRPLPRKCDVLSQLDPNSDSSYEQDSFCVDEGDHQEMSQMCPLELAEAVLEQGRRRRRAHRSPGSPQKKRRRIVCGPDDGSSDEDHVSVSGAVEPVPPTPCPQHSPQKPATVVSYSDVSADFSKRKDDERGIEVSRCNRKISPLKRVNSFKVSCGVQKGRSEQQSNETLPRVQLNIVTGDKSSCKNVAELKTASTSDTSGIGSINFDFLTDDLFEEFEVVEVLTKDSVAAPPEQSPERGRPSDLAELVVAPQEQLVVLVGSRQNSVASHVTAMLRASHAIDTHVVFSREAHYIISRRVAVLRLCTANMARPSYRPLLEEAVLLLRAHYPHPVVILEDGRPSTGAGATWNRLAISRLSALLRARLRLLFSTTQEETAYLVAMLARRERDEGHAIAPFSDQQLHSEVFRFVSRLPGINFVCALQLVRQFPRIADFLRSCSSLDSLREVTGLSRSCASRVHLVLSGVIQP